MFFSRTAAQRWFLAVFLLCSPAPRHGRPIDALSGRTRRSVSHTQLMHDKSRTLQDFRRRLWLQELLDVVHTAQTRDQNQNRDLPVLQTSTTGSTLHSKPPGGTKNLPDQNQNQDQDQGGTNLPQETLKSGTYKDALLKGPGRKKKKGRSGKRREGEKRRRRARSVPRRPPWTWTGLQGLQGL
ncbi:parathyroid hormone-like hormone a [Cololabis saira]|uniref:parathyroid hormone-like hormone a n=1 Tax=Cololabis saira TaxID=129043 RepID=UPI002AD37DC9|nr:parathyroid hormone-like hormone a [Cololabis saira]